MTAVKIVFISVFASLFSLFDILKGNTCKARCLYFYLRKLEFLKDLLNERVAQNYLLVQKVKLFNKVNYVVFFFRLKYLVVLERIYIYQQGNMGLISCDIAAIY